MGPILMAGQTRARLSNHPPVYFSDDGRGFENAHPPSDEVLRAILETPAARDAANDLDNDQKANLKSFFQSAPARLAMAPEEGYVVIGHVPMGGGDNDWFWIVGVHGGRAKVLLFERGDAIRIRSNSRHGFHDVELDWYVGARWGRRIYSFDGSKYKLIRELDHEGDR